ncbi:leucine dehydrogenase [Anaeramoeba ignava]|uniref:Leucine dehydrogenase n=1 Tax=Anaeramoeba ignava TaxID=1746090 RepID=A0A9Q0RD31_ANAIG|nr:leucine dehydrogenase [Anaeramoeba ignava]
MNQQQKNSLFLPLINEGFTTLKIFQNKINNTINVCLLKEWDEDIKWSNYNNIFTVESLLTEDMKVANNKVSREIFAKYKLTSYLEKVIDLIQKGRHFGIECFIEKKLGIRFINNIHTNVLGINNRKHAIRSGGIRRFDPEIDELEIIQDGLNLSRAMSYKNFAAELNYGGSKIIVQSEKIKLEDEERKGFIGYAIDRTRSFTGPDMGFSPEFADALNQKYTLNIAGGTKILGPSGTPAAYGVFLAVKEAVKFKMNLDSLNGIKIAIQGLGCLGFSLAELFLKENAKLFVADISNEKSQRLIQKYPNHDISVVDSENILSIETDIFSPCAIGGILTRQNIPDLKFKIILGGANNQLKASSVQEELDLAQLLFQRDILFQVDWCHNVGGVICGCEEYENLHLADINKVYQKTEKICSIKMRENLEKSQKMNISLTHLAYQEAEKAIY